MSNLINEEISKYEKLERNRTYPLILVFEDEKTISEEIYKDRGNFRRRWSNLLKEHFDFLLTEEFDIKLILQYGELMFGNNKKAYIKY